MFKKLEHYNHLQLMMNIIIIVFLASEIVYTSYVVYSYRDTQHKLLAEPLITVPQENIKVEFEWYEGVYVTNYSFNLIQDGKYKSCELEIMQNETSDKTKTYSYQKELKIRMYDGKVYTEDGGLILCQPT